MAEVEVNAIKIYF
jgi:hypothetical protein